MTKYRCFVQHRKTGKWYQIGGVRRHKSVATAMKAFAHDVSYLDPDYIYPLNLRIEAIYE